MFDLGNRVKPVIWIPKERPERSLQDVKFEATANYFVFWFHWPKDGYAVTNIHEDYEPVILIMKGEEIIDIGVRPHNSYRHSRKWLDNHGRPVIIFRTAWHEAVIFSGQPSARFFASPRVSNLLVNYTLEEGAPPEWFIRADSGQSVYSYALELSKARGRH